MRWRNDDETLPVQPPIVRMADFYRFTGGDCGGDAFLSEPHCDHRLAKLRDDLLADDSNDRHANCDFLFNSWDR